MKKTKSSNLPTPLQKALDLFPSIVSGNKKKYAKKQKFIERTFGEIARKVHREVHGKKSDKY
jgi:hypothetical protein